MRATAHQLLVRVMDCSLAKQRLDLTDEDRSVLYEHMKTLPELSDDSDLRTAARALVEKLSTLTWRDRELGFREWKVLADVLEAPRAR